MRHAKRWMGALAVLAMMSSPVLAAAATTAAHATPGVEVHAGGSVKDVVKSLRKMVADNGMMVMGELHQGKVLGMTGLKVESETIFVGSPTVGKKLFTEDPGVGLVVPMRINVYADGNGNTIVSYVPPSRLLSGFENPKIDMIAKMLDGKFQMLTQMLARK